MFYMKLKKYDKSIIFIIFTIFISLLIWWISLPVFQSFDEPAHFAQIQHIAETNQYDMNNTISNEQFLLENFLKFNIFNANVNSQYHFISKNYNIRKYIFDKKSNTKINRNTFTHVAIVENYPPLYYYISAVVYKITKQKSIFFSIEAIRFISIFFFLITLIFSYKIALLIFPEDIWIQYCTVIFIGFLPMLSQLSVSINPDNLLITLFTLFTYYSLKLLRSSGFSQKTNIVLVIILLLGFMTKQSAYILCIPYLFLIGYKLKNKKLSLRYKQILILGFFFLILIFFFLKGFTLIFDYISGTFNSWKYFSPLDYIYKYSTNYFFNGYVFQSFWGAFGWGFFKFPQQYYDILYLFLSTSIIGIIIYYYNLTYITKKNRKLLYTINYLIILSLTYSLFLVYLDFISIKNTGTFFIQGHYFFEIITANTILFLFGIGEFFKRFKLKNTIYFIIIIGIVLLNTTGLFQILINKFYL